MPKRKLSLIQLRNRARELLRGFRDGDALAHARVFAALSRFAGSDSSRFKLAHAFAVIARENNYPSWEKLVASAAAEGRRLARRQLRSASIRSLAAEIGARAKAHDAAGLARMRGIGKEDSRKVIEIIAADRDSWRCVVDAYILGLSHESPVVRYECAHMLDRFGDPEAIDPLVKLTYDPVPRVRWMALHALSCDICKSDRPHSEEALVRATKLALEDESIQVRRHATVAVAQLGGREAEPFLRQLERDQDTIVRRNAVHMLRLLKVPRST